MDPHGSVMDAVLFCLHLHYVEGILLSLSYSQVMKQIHRYTGPRLSPLMLMFDETQDFPCCHFTLALPLSFIHSAPAKHIFLLFTL